MTTRSAIKWPGAADGGAASESVSRRSTAQQDQKGPGSAAGICQSQPPAEVPSLSRAG